MSNLEHDDSDHNEKSSDLTNFANNSTMNNTQADSNEEKYRDRIEADRSHELICLKDDDKRIILAEGKAFESYWNQYNTRPSTVTTNLNFNNQVFVISFVGDTRSGKSFLANQLGVESVVINEEDYQGPTTAKCNVF